MKKIGLILILFMLTILPCVAKSKEDNSVNQETPENVFIYHLPDDESSTGEDSDIQKNTDENPLMVIPEEEISPSEIDKTDNMTDENSVENEESNADETSDDEESIEEDNSNVLKGYAEYNEGEEDTITLDNPEKTRFNLHIKKPSKIEENDYTKLKTTSLKFDNYKYSKYNSSEYSISPLSSTNYRKKGSFTAGTLYNQIIDTGELEQSSGIFSSYSYKQFGLSTAYTKTVNSTNSNYDDNLYIAPEYKLNQYLTLKEILSADITKNRKKAEFVFSVNPLGSKDPDRLRLEFGASQTYDDTNALIKNQFKFSTNIKL